MLRPESLVLIEFRFVVHVHRCLKVKLHREDAGGFTGRLGM